MAKKKDACKDAPDIHRELIDSPKGGKIVAPWPKGVSGNPKGKPKGTKSITTYLKELMDRQVKVVDNDITDDAVVPVSMAVSLQLVKQAINGDKNAITIILDRLEGKPKETIDATINKPVPDWVLEMNQPVADNPV